jgi:poly(A) polymerase
MKLENSGDAMLDIAHPFIKGFEQVAHCVTEEEVRLAAQGDTTEELKARTQDDVEGKEGAKSIWTMTFYIGLQVKPKQRACPPPPPFLRAPIIVAFWPLNLPACFAAGDNSKRKLDISYPTTDFMKQVKMIDSFEEATMGIVVRHIRK